MSFVLASRNRCYWESITFKYICERIPKRLRMIVYFYALYPLFSIEKVNNEFTELEKTCNWTLHMWKIHEHISPTNKQTPREITTLVFNIYAKLYLLHRHILINGGKYRDAFKDVSLNLFCWIIGVETGTVL